MEKNTSLYFQEGTSDKVYHIQLKKKDSGYVVNFQYGRRKGSLKEDTKTLVPISLGAAEHVYSKLLQEKLKKGYREM